MHESSASEGPHEPFGLESLTPGKAKACLGGREARFIHASKPFMAILMDKSQFI